MVPCFQGKSAWTNDRESVSKVSPEIGIRPWMALPRFCEEETMTMTRIPSQKTSYTYGHGPLKVALTEEKKDDHDQKFLAKNLHIWSWSPKYTRICPYPMVWPLLGEIQKGTAKRGRHKKCHILSLIVAKCLMTLYDDL